MRLPRNKTQRINIQKVLLAVHWLADDSILRCTATNAEIGAVCGLTGTTVSGYVRDLARAGEVAIVGYNPSDGFTRSIVFLDHPDADQLIRHARSCGSSVFQEA